MTTVQPINKTEAFKAVTKQRIAALKHGQTLLNSVRKIAGDKYSLEFITVVVKPNQGSIDLTVAFNKGDDRFKDKSVIVRYTHLAVTADGAMATVGLNLSAVTEEGMDLNILDPKHVSGVLLTTEIRETSEATMKMEVRAKRANSTNWLKSDGSQIYAADGGRVYRSSVIVAGAAKHRFIEKMDVAASVPAPVVAAVIAGDLS